MFDLLVTKIWSSRGALGALAIGAALYIFFAATTSRIPGYGADGQSYAAMAKAFSLTQLGHMPSIIAPHNTRYLPSAIAHYIHPDPIVAFTLMNMVAIAGLILAYYGILRFYGLPIKWALVAIVLFLVASPALRFWIYYPVLTDQIGNALLLGTIWTILTKRYLPYSLLAAALMATRENGAILLVFFVLFHANPWNPHRDKKGHAITRIARLFAWNILPLLVLLQVRLFPVFPQSNVYNMMQTALYAMNITLASAEKQHQMLLAVLNSFGLLLYVLCWGVFRLGMKRTLTVLRENPHWVWYVLINIFFAPLSWTDHERFLLVAVPVLVLACVRILRALPVAPGVKLMGVVALIISYAYLSHDFSPIEYFQLFGSVMNASSANRMLKIHTILAIALGTALLAKLIVFFWRSQLVRRWIRRGA